MWDELCKSKNVNVVDDMRISMSLIMSLNLNLQTMFSHANSLLWCTKERLRYTSCDVRINICHVTYIHINTLSCVEKEVWLTRLSITPSEFFSFSCDAAPNAVLWNSQPGYCYLYSNADKIIVSLFYLMAKRNVYQSP